MDSDLELARRAQAGGREAFDALVDRHGPGLLAFLRRLTGRPEEALDLFQETFLRAYRNLPGLREPERFRSWLASIAVNLARKQFARRGREGRLALEPDMDAVLPPGAAAAPALEQLEAGERRAALRGALERLPPRQKAVLALRLDMNLPFAEIGRNLGLREDNARAHHYQALLALKRMLAPRAAPSAAAPGRPTGGSR